MLERVAFDQTRIPEVTTDFASAGCFPFRHHNANAQIFFCLPDLTRVKSGRACLPPAGAIPRPPRQARPDLRACRASPTPLALRLAPSGNPAGRPATGRSSIRSSAQTRSYDGFRSDLLLLAGFTTDLGKPTPPPLPCGWHLQATLPGDLPPAGRTSGPQRRPEVTTDFAQIFFCLLDLTRVKSGRACLPTGRRVPAPPRQARPDLRAYRPSPPPLALRLGTFRQPYRATCHRQVAHPVLIGDALQGYYRAENLPHRR